MREFHNAKIKQKSQQQGPIDQYLGRLGVKTQGNRGPGSDGGSSHNNDGVDAGGNFQESLQQSQNASELERYSNFHTHKGTHREVDFSEPQHGFSNWETKHDFLSKEEFYKLLQQDQVRNEEVFNSQNLLNSSDEQSTVICSPIENFPDNIIKIWTQLDTLSYAESGLILCNLCLFMMYLMCMALMIFLVRNKLIKFFVTQNRRILNFLKNQFSRYFFLCTSFS